MKIGVLASSSSWHFLDLQRASEERHQLIPLSFSELGGTIQNSGGEIFAGTRPLSDFDCILVRAMPAGSLEQVVARMDLLFRLEKLGVPVINPAKSIEAAVDKYLSLCRLKDCGIGIPDSGIFQTTEPALEFFRHHQSDIVYKPVFGSEGRGIERLTDPRVAKELFDQLVSENKLLYLQEFIPNVAKDLRLFVVGQNVFGMSRHNEEDWRKNISRGGKALAHPVSGEEKKLAIACSTAVGTHIAGVDIIIDHEGHYLAIEVNSSPGWQTLSQTLQIDIASEIVKFLEN